MRSEDVDLLERLGMLHCWRCHTSDPDVLQVAEFTWFEPPLRVMSCLPCGAEVAKVMVGEAIEQLGMRNPGEDWLCISCGTPLSKGCDHTGGMQVRL